MRLRALVGAAALLCASSGSGQSRAVTPQQWDGVVKATQTAIMLDARSGSRRVDQAEALARSIRSPRLRDRASVDVLRLKGEALLRVGAVASARPLIARARTLVMRSTPRSKLAGDVVLLSGWVRSAEGDFAAALRDYQDAFRVFQQVDEARSQAIALVYIADLYGDAKDYETALRYLEQAAEDRTLDDKLRLSLLNNSGHALIALGRHAQAAEAFVGALAIARRLNSPALESPVRRNILRAQLAGGELAAAGRMAEQAAFAARRAGGGEVPATNSVLAQLALQRGDLGRAQRLIDGSFAGVDPGASTVSMREAHLTAYRVFSRAKRTADALAHLEVVKRLDDQSTQLATRTGTALMRARFDFANQELRIARMRAEELRRSVAFAQERARTERFYYLASTGAGAVVMALLALALFVVRRSRDTVRATAAELAVINGELEKALAVKSEFLATTSHEIRTPLNGILGMAQVMLADRALPDASRERVRLLHGAGETMRALIDDILDMAKIERGGLQVEAAPFDLAALLRDAARLWEDQVRAKGIAFDMAVDLPPGRVVGDAARVRQVVFNLVSNAAKFTATGAITLSAALGGDGVHRIAVSDTGVGIDEGKLGRVFEPFAQADAGTARRFGGTGLGLAISRNLARAMGGELSVESRAGEGATFTLALPLAAAAEIEPEAVRPRGALLVVADRNPIARAMLRSLLGDRAGGVVAVADLAELRDAVEAHAPARLLVDEGVLAGEPLDAVLAELAAGAHVTLLRTGGAGAVGVAGVTVLEKPVSGPALVAAVLSPAKPDGYATAIVSRAA